MLVGTDMGTLKYDESNHMKSTYLEKIDTICFDIEVWLIECKPTR